MGRMMMTCGKKNGDNRGKVQGSTARFGRARALAAAAVLAGAPMAQAAMITWTANSGSWNTSGNWSAGGPAGTTNTDTAVLSSSAGAKTITLDSTFSIGQLDYVATQTGTVTINNGSGGPMGLRAN